LFHFLKDLEIPSEGDFVPFDDDTAIGAFNIVFILEFFASGNLQFGALAFADYAIRQN
jgi:hypothetical protein